VSIRGAGQPTAHNIRIAQAGCRYAVSQPAFSFDAAGGGGSFDVVQTVDPATCGGQLPNGCQWTPTSDVLWISIPNDTIRVRNEPVIFTVAANPTGVARAGTIAIGDTVVQITQAVQ
jgi:hypothetical protein